MNLNRKKIILRPTGKSCADLIDLNPLFQRILTARGIRSLESLDRHLKKLPSPWLLSNMDLMANRLMVAIKEHKKIVVVADFDADGATSCAIAIRGLQLLGAYQPSFIVPNRFEYAYGLTPELVDLVKQKNPKVAVIITVDNGISSFAGVESAKALGIEVLVTDHHLPADVLPKADAIVNPNLAEDKFPSRNLAGCGVMFYVLMGLRTRLRECGFFNRFPEPNLGQLLDYVALGTVADVVQLDEVNRILVHNGLLRMRAGAAHFGIIALAEIAGKKLENLKASDLGFSLAPRLNAAGRMDDMSLGIQCLLADELETAKNLALQLDDLNKTRKEVESQMKQQAMLILDELHYASKAHLSSGLCLFEEDWHQGVIGILAARIKEKFNRPVVAFAVANNNEIKGSARSIAGVHIRDVLADIAAAHPKMLTNFGGHAMAAGLSLHRHDYPAFAIAFNDAVAQRLKNVDLQQKILSDGELSETHFTVDFAENLQALATWGQGFPEPVFNGLFDVIQCRIVGGHHLKFTLRQPNADLLIDAIAFFVDSIENYLGMRQIQIAYKLDINDYRGQRSLQLMIEYFEKNH